MSSNEIASQHETILHLIDVLTNGSNWDLNAQKLTDDDVKILAERLQSNKNCKVLHLHLNNIGDDGMVYLAEMLKTNQTITDLYLAANDIGDRGMKTFCQVMKDHNRTLIVIDLMYNQITDDSIDGILDLFEVNNNLRGLMLTGNKISDESKTKLRETARMKNISLGNDF